VLFSGARSVITSALGGVTAPKILSGEVTENRVFLDPESTERLQLVMFLTVDAQLRASSSCAPQNSFFIGPHDQELRVFGSKKSNPH
jgi:hypothetical protein